MTKTLTPQRTSTSKAWVLRSFISFSAFSLSWRRILLGSMQAPISTYGAYEYLWNLYGIFMEYLWNIYGIFNVCQNLWHYQCKLVGWTHTTINLPAILMMWTKEHHRFWPKAIWCQMHITYTFTILSNHINISGHWEYLHLPSGNST